MPKKPTTAHTNAKTTLMVGLTFGLLSAIALYMGINWFLLHQAKQAHEQSLRASGVAAIATIQSQHYYDPSCGRSASCPYIEVNYRYLTSAGPETGTADIVPATGAESLPGATIAVHYSPNTPADSLADSVRTNSEEIYLPTLGGLVAAIFLGIIAFGCVIQYRQERRQELAKGHR